MDVLTQSSTSTTDRNALQKPQTDLNNYHIVQTLGEGAFGEVMLIVDNINPQCASAMKRMSIEEGNKEMFSQIKKEALIQRMLSRPGHDNIIRMIGMRSDKDYFYLFLEYADGGELFDKIDPDVGMASSRAQFYFRQLINGVTYIHDAGVVHRDLKPENLLLTSSSVLKISDFGMATIFRHEGKERILNMSCGTLPYAAPEVINGKEYSGPPVDVWSAGIVLITMLTGELPWDKADDTSAVYLNWITNTNLDETPWNKIDVRGLSFLRKLVTNKVDKRATLDYIKNHDWYTFNYAAAEVEARGRTSNKRKFDEVENIPSTQIPSYCVAKRPYSEACVFDSREKTTTSFSQPTNIDDLLLSQNMSQGAHNLHQRMVRRMTRFCVKIDVDEAIQKTATECENTGFSVKQKSDVELLVTYREVSMMVTAYYMSTAATGELVMLDFRRSRGDGLQFKRMFTAVRLRMEDLICAAGNNWLENCGLTPVAHEREFPKLEMKSAPHVDIEIRKED